MVALHTRSTSATPEPLFLKKSSPITHRLQLSSQGPQSPGAPKNCDTMTEKTNGARVGAAAAATTTGSSSCCNNNSNNNSSSSSSSSTITTTITTTTTTSSNSNNSKSSGGGGGGGLDYNRWTRGAWFE
ncbi:hypothetical protein B0T13DRAFT_510479 [Neurospora crassa]|nr:hypothetical protein B0T13DRAFT_510479 [Neurospora crassa]